MFQLFHSLTKDDHLHGLVAGFLIRKKDSLLKLLQLLPFDASAHNDMESILRPIVSDHGLITFDTKLSGSVQNLGDTTIIGGGGIKFGETIGERMHNGSDCQRKAGQYAVIYYSGHGNSEGDLQIEQNVAITPEDLDQISRSTEVPYLIVLDMCFSYRFGYRYRELLKQGRWNGAVDVRK